MNIKKNVLLIFGGCSPEHNISCYCAADFIDSIDYEKFNLYVVGITKSGEWLLTDANSKEIRDSKKWLQNNSNRSVTLSINKKNKGLIILNDNNTYKIQKIDVVFPYVIGETGEDGTLQGLLNLAGIPYVGSRVFASACCNDKSKIKSFAQSLGLKCPESTVVAKEEFIKNKDIVIERINMFATKYPVFVKPATTGSSIGVSMIKEKKEIIEAIDLAFKYSDTILVEEAIVGTEIKVGIMGNDELEIGQIWQISFKEGTFEDYESKYVTHPGVKLSADNIPKILKKQIETQARLIYTEIGCRGFARVDFFLSNLGILYFNEINTVPGFSKTSCFPAMFMDIGVAYQSLISQLIDLAY